MVCMKILAKEKLRFQYQISEKEMLGPRSDAIAKSSAHIGVKEVSVNYEPKSIMLPP